MTVTITRHSPTIRVADVKFGQLFFQTGAESVVLVRLSKFDRINAKVPDTTFPCVVIADEDQAGQGSYLQTGEIVILDQNTAVVLLQVTKGLEVRTK